MAKVIAISDSLYEKLSKAKGSESFTKLLSEMLDAYRRSSDISVFAGALKGSDVGAWLKDIEHGRKSGFRRELPTL